LAWVPLWLVLIRSGDLQYRPPAAKTGGAEPIRPGRFIFQILTLATIGVSISLAWQFQRAWLPKYLKEFHHYSEATANYFTSGYYIVADIGCLFFGGVVSVLTARCVPIHWARLVSFAGCVALVALSVAVPALERGPLMLVALVLVGAGSLGAHPQYYALIQELPPRHMGVLSGLLSATSWVAVGRMQGTIGDDIKRTGSYDWPLIATGLAPLAGLVVLTAWVALAPRRPETARSL